MSQATLSMGLTHIITIYVCLLATTQYTVFPVIHLIVLTTCFMSCRFELFAIFVVIVLGGCGKPHFCDPC